MTKQKYDYIVEKFNIRPADFKKKEILWRNVCIALTDAKTDIIEGNYYQWSYYDKFRLNDKYFNNRYYGYIYHIAFNRIKLAINNGDVFADYQLGINLLTAEERKARSKRANRAEGRLRNQLAKLLL